MKLDAKWESKYKPCQPAVEFLAGFKSRDAIEVLEHLIGSGHYAWAEWALTRCLSKKGRVAFAAICARSVLHLFEAKYPHDNRPRLAIEAAENGDTDAAYAANAVNAANAAANAAAYDAAYAAAYAAANAAANAANAAANAAAYAANAAAYDANAVNAANAAAYDAAYAAAYAAANAAANAAAYDATRTANLKKGLEILKAQETKHFKKGARVSYKRLLRGTVLKVSRDLLIVDFDNTDNLFPNTVYRVLAKDCVRLVRKGRPNNAA